MVATLRSVIDDGDVPRSESTRPTDLVGDPRPARTAPAEPTNALAALVSVQGRRRERNCDAGAYAVFHDVIAAAVVDGSGSAPEVARFAADAAPAVAGVTARRGSPVLGIVTASEMCSDVENLLPSPSGAVVAAVSRPDGRWLVAWAGDSVAWAVRDGQAWLATKPHTRGQLLRDEGADEDEARLADRDLLNDLARVPLYGLSGNEVIAPMLVLASDGLKLAPEDVARIAVEDPEPSACARALVRAAQEKGVGDDVTALVVHHPAVDDPGAKARGGGPVEDDGGNEKEDAT